MFEHMLDTLRRLYDAFSGNALPGEPFTAMEVFPVSGSYDYYKLSAVKDFSLNTTLHLSLGTSAVMSSHPVEKAVLYAEKVMEYAQSLSGCEEYVPSKVSDPALDMALLLADTLWEKDIRGETWFFSDQGRYNYCYSYSDRGTGWRANLEFSSPASDFLGIGKDTSYCRSITLGNDIAIPLAQVHYADLQDNLWHEAADHDTVSADESLAMIEDWVGSLVKRGMLEGYGGGSHV